MGCGITRSGCGDVNRVYETSAPVPEGVSEGGVRVEVRRELLGDPLSLPHSIARVCGVERGIIRFRLGE